MFDFIVFILTSNIFLQFFHIFHELLFSYETHMSKYAMNLEVTWHIAAMENSYIHLSPDGSMRKRLKHSMQSKVC